MFQRRINDLLNSKNVSQTDLAKYIGYTSQAIGRWCRGETEPDLNSLIKIANFFDVSIDFLLGNEKNANKLEQEIKEKEILKDKLIKIGYMKDGEDLTDDELKKLMEFVKTNKKYIKGLK